jgi:hypothetical protein
MSNIAMPLSLLKKELAAINSYRQVIKKLSSNVNKGESESLMCIYLGHKAAVVSLEAEMGELGETLSAKMRDTNELGTTVSSIPHRFCKKTALRQLLDGEKSVTAEYNQMLQSSRLPLYLRCLIEWKLLLVQQSHQRTVGQMLDAAIA